MRFILPPHSLFSLNATFLARRERLRSLLHTHQLDAILVFASRRESSYMQWVSGIKPRIFTYYYLRAQSSGFLEIDYNIESLKVRTDEKILPVTEDLVHKDLARVLHGYKRVGLIGPAPFDHLRHMRKEIVMLNKYVDPWMTQKSEEEIAGIIASVDVVKRVLVSADALIKPGAREKDIASNLRLQLLAEGDELAFPTTVLSGPRLAITTAGTPSERALEPIDVVCVDMGLVRNGYCSDCTRMFFLGEHPAKKHYDNLVVAHHAVIQSLTVGMPIRVVVERYREEIAKHHLPADTLVVPDLGHSIGFYVHEYPFFYRSEYDRYTLVDGMVFALEPEIVFPQYRLRVEDMICMQGGKPVILTGQALPCR